jgi:hypothetical protein
VSSSQVVSLRRVTVGSTAGNTDPPHSLMLLMWPNAEAENVTACSQRHFAFFTAGGLIDRDVLHGTRESVDATVMSSLPCLPSFPKQLH